VAEPFTTEELQAQLRALYQARRSGARRVELGDRRTEFRTDAEIAAAIGDLERRLSGTAPHAIVIRSTKGW
jgi:hypothetical protein